MIQGWAAHPGFKTYEDRASGRGYFSKALEKLVKESGHVMSIWQLLQALHDQVLSDTKGLQRPWLVGATGERPVFLVRKGASLSIGGVTAHSVLGDMLKQLDRDLPLLQSREIGAVVDAETEFRAPAGDSDTPKVGKGCYVLHLWKQCASWSYSCLCVWTRAWFLRASGRSRRLFTA